MFNINKNLIYDPAEVFYMVDSNYRTAVQGWTQSDGTGPLDLHNAKNVGRVFYTDGGPIISSAANDAAAIQAGIDAMVDFRGDTLFFTAGIYTPATALSIDVSDARWLGQKVTIPTNSRVSLTAGVASAFTMTAAADRFECAYFRMVPLTAATAWTVPANTDNAHFHDIFYDAAGISANTSTVFLTHAGATARHWTFEKVVMWTDAAQGPFVDTTGAIVNWKFLDFDHVHTAGTLATSLWETTGTGTGPVLIEKFRGRTAVAGVVTTMITLVEGGSDLAWVHSRDVVNNIGYCAATAMITLGTAEAGETDFSNCYLGLVGGFTPGTGNDGRGTGTPYTQ